MTLRRLSLYRLRIFLAAGAGLVAFAALSCASSERLVLPETMDLIAVPEEERWLLAIAAPVASRLSAGGNPPLLVALMRGPEKSGAGFLKELDPRRCLALASSDEVAEACGGKDICHHLITTGKGPLQAGVLLAKRFWKDPERVVVAPLEDPEAVILGATLAAHAGVPFIPIELGDGIEGFAGAMRELKARQAIVVNTSAVDLSALLKDVAPMAEFLGRAAAETRIVREVGGANVRNVILGRVPGSWHVGGVSSWLAPYLSLVRGAPVVLCKSSEGTDAEARVKEFVAGRTLRPRSVTILGACDSIGEIAVRGEGFLGEYEVTIEPCSGSGREGASSFAVGRLPFRTLYDNSMLMARGMARERRVNPVSPRILMIANPNTEYGPLLLCETVSRVTAAEFKNLRVPINEVYRIMREEKSVVTAAETAQVIIFEGHITDLWLFGDTEFDDDLHQEPERDDGDQEHRPDIHEAQDDQKELLMTTAEPVGMSWRPAPVPGARDERRGAWICMATCRGSDQATPASTVPARLPEEAGDKETPPVSVTRLQGSPLVVLQSCYSLDEARSRRIFDLGAAGLIGSVTSIHSASGSAFIKAFCDGLLYGRETVGEALRDARNYFLCLAMLKSERGHKEQAKAFRVALSFRLWGDPEMRIPLKRGVRPRRVPISARFVDANTVQVTTPERRLPKCITEQYIAHIFPGAQLAGIVKRLKNREQRRLMPLYFFKFPVPEDFPYQRWRRLFREGDDCNRAVFLADPIRRSVYVLYFPEKEKCGETFTLHFAE